MFATESSAASFAQPLPLTTLIQDISCRRDFGLTACYVMSCCDAILMACPLDCQTLISRRQDWELFIGFAEVFALMP